METAILAVGLSKRFGAFLALAGLDLAVARGEVLGYLGPGGGSAAGRLLAGTKRVVVTQIRPGRRLAADHEAAAPRGPGRRLADSGAGDLTRSA